MQDSVAFHRLIAAAPDDDAPRLVYADWLEERGDPRGTFVRVQCALARLPSEHPRRRELEQVEDELFQTHGAAWAHGVAGRVSGYKFRRGFIDEITLRAEAFLENAPILLRQGTIRTVHLLNAVGHVGALARSLYLTRIRALDLCGNQLWDNAAQLLARSPAVRGVTSLDLSFNSLSSVGVQALAAAKSWPRLQSLDLRGNDRIDDRGAAALARAVMPALATLDLRDCRLGPAGLWALIRGKALPKLADFGYAGNALGDGGARALAASPRLATLLLSTKTIDLSHTGLTPVGLRTLLADDRLAGVRTLRLDGNGLADAGAAALAAARLPQLCELYLSGNDITDDGAAALAGSPLLGRLHWLSLRDNALTAAADVILRESPYWNWRTVIETEDNRPPAPERGDARLPFTWPDDESGG
jgi:uncharacterized protein (TIGR02996 family)